MNRAPINNDNLSLYFTNLAEAATEQNLSEAFRPHNLQSCRIFRDPLTGKSQGRGYLNFSNATDADTALDVQNFHEILKQSILLSRVQRDKAARQSQVANLFIRFPTDQDVDIRRFHNLFTSYGPIHSCKIPLSNGKSKGFGFVQFEKQEDAKKAIDDPDMGNNGFKVAHYVKREQRTPIFTNVFVRNMPAETTKEQLNSFFSSCGEITSSFCNTSAFQATVKAFGFVNFKTHEEAQKAIDTLDGKDFFGSTITVCEALSKERRARMLKDRAERARNERSRTLEGANLYVFGLLPEVSDNILRDTFAEFGKVSSVRIVVGQDGMSTGRAYVCLSSSDEAQAAIAKYNGQVVLSLNPSRPLTVSLYRSYHDRDNDRLRSFAMAERGGVRVPMPNYPGQTFPFNNFMHPMPNRFVNQPRTNNRGRPTPVAGNMKQPRMSYPQMMMQQPQHYHQQMLHQHQQQQQQQPTSAIDRQRFGEMLFPLVSQINEANAPKITGMLIELPAEQVDRLTRDHDFLAEKVRDALNMLNSSN